MSVTLSCTESHAILTVEDDGPGFSEDIAARLRSGGGLAGLRERVAVLGGELKIENRNENGAVVSVQLPLQNGNEE